MNRRLPLLRNFDEHGNPLPRPRTLLIDSEQLDSGEALNNLGAYGRWVFAELTDIYAMEEDFRGRAGSGVRALVEPAAL